MTLNVSVSDICKCSQHRLTSASGRLMLSVPGVAMDGRVTEEWLVKVQD